MKNKEMCTTLNNGLYNYHLRLFAYGNGWRVQYVKADMDANLTRVMDSEDKEYTTYGMAWQNYWRLFSIMSIEYSYESPQPAEWEKQIITLDK